MVGLDTVPLGDSLKIGERPGHREVFVKSCFKVFSKLCYLEPVMVNFELTADTYLHEGIIGVPMVISEGFAKSSEERFCPRDIVQPSAAGTVDLFSRQVVQIVPLDIQFLLEQPLSFFRNCVLHRVVVDAAIYHFPWKPCYPGAYFTVSNAILKEVPGIQTMSMPDHQDVYKVISQPPFLP